MASPTHGQLLPPLSTSQQIQLPSQPMSLLNGADHHGTSLSSPEEEEAYSSALTSPTASMDPLTNPNPASALHPPQPLRKSLSVDSFVQYVRDDATTSTGTRQSRVNTGTAVDPPRNLIYGMSDGLRRERERERSQRSRGASVSTTADEDDYPYAGDSDVERSDPLLRSTSGYRAVSLKGQDHPRMLVRAGELPLPSRTPTISSTSSTSSIGAISNSSTQDESPRLRSAASLQTMPRRTGVLANSMTGRVRSGSLGVYSPPSVNNAGVRMVINTQVSSHSDISPITLAIVGVKGCGKSIAVRKGLKGYSLAEPSTFSPPPHHNPAWSRYSQRVGRFSRDSNNDHPLYIIEIDVTPASLDPPSTRAVAWPEGTPRVDGVIICYDSSDETSFAPVESLLRGYRVALKLPVIVLACKSDLQRQVHPEKALELLQRYDVGLVEVTTTTDMGKDRLRRSFEWLLKVIVRTRTNRGLDSLDRNPASPDILNLPPLPEYPPTGTPGATPTTSSSMTSMRTVAQAQAQTRNIEAINGTDGHQEEQRDDRERQSRPAQWATLEELLDKLLFLAVSGDDPSYITHFLLTYRRFATPRDVILAMQRRMRQLDNPSGDPMFACFAQMRICHLLEQWRCEYKHDFAVKGTSGALNALTKSIVSKTYLLHYGSELLPFLEELPTLVDKDAAWAMKPDEPPPDSEESSDEEEFAQIPDAEPPRTRDRKQSLPLAGSLLVPIMGVSPSSLAPRIIKDLQKIAQDVNVLDAEAVAQQITKVQVEAFLAIEPRHWMQYTLVSGKKDPATDPIARFNAISNCLGDWVVSLILCHDKPRLRAKQIEKFIDIAAKLRAHNNYAALRAFVAGINNSTFPGDDTMERFNKDYPEQTKNLRSWEVLLQAIGSHRAYRLALRNTKGVCVPALEVHMSDLIRAHEGNPDFSADDSTRVHWGKFNMMGRFINSTTLCQAQCRASDYKFQERPAIKSLIFDTPVMDIELQKSRIAPPDDADDDYRVAGSHTNPNSHMQAKDKDVALLRKLFFW
ncbi:hypothetical protein ONZ45_g898 [Pleurotus djamor]|nr:hypothetical protein ONZ45_g898 [Pleurotus djamor]